MVGWVSSYLFNGDTVQDGGLGGDEAETTLNKIRALYEQAKAGFGGGSKVSASPCYFASILITT